ncbi:TPA: hypothetical protein U5Z37_001649 [Streptococcus agalactiae]|nr:hypothetical protein [Streptococcus agalactiae]HEN4434327.1 hypothetical protein [Streptococcus agalactiae]HEN4438207.1 hypothetical protein [Streptococcus agalactiae]HEN4442256.1 hypothetical protein [Streptococcus agalactiae]HEN4480425.1 hypothetical protein [Streptococcus agalactiae]
MTEYAVIINVETGQRRSFPLPFPIHALERIGVTASYSGQLEVYPEKDDTFGFGLDGHMYLSELEGYLENYRRRQNPYHHDYMMLSALQTDCDYFLGNGYCQANRLWEGSVENHIKEMKRLWKLFPEGEKPEWLTWEQILDYEKKMKNDEL